MKRTADWLTRMLRKQGYSALSLHGDKSQTERNFVMNGKTFTSFSLVQQRLCVLQRLFSISQNLLKLLEFMISRLKIHVLNFLNYVEQVQA